MAEDPRVTRLRTAARTKSEAKTRAAETALRELVKTGSAITFRTVATRAGVSHSFLYAHPELRSRIEHLRSRHRPAPVSAPAAESGSEPALVAGLSAKVDQLRRDHRGEVAGLREALEAAHGENLALRRLLAEHGIGHPSPGGGRS